MEPTSFNFLKKHHKIKADHTIEEQVPLRISNNSDAYQEEIESYAPHLDLTDPSMEYEECCECDNCIIGFATFWLGCGCAELGYSVVFWYIVNLISDVYTIVAEKESKISLVLSTFNIMFVDAPVLFFAVRDERFKFIFPFACDSALTLIQIAYGVEKCIVGSLRDGLLMIFLDGLLFFGSSIALVPLFTYRLKLWNKTNVSYSRLYPHSSALPF